MVADLALAAEDGVFHAERFLHAGKTGLIGFGIEEAHGVGGGELGVELGPLAVEDEIETVPGIDTEVMAALGANPAVVLKILTEDDLLAPIAFDPKAFCANGTVAIAGCVHSRLVALEPRHELIV